MIGNLCILSTVIIVSWLMIEKLVKRDFALGPDITWFNSKDFASMIGFACYAYEGIGVVMPIMDSCACPEQFHNILIAALLTLAFVYISFAEIVYLTLG